MLLVWESASWPVTAWSRHRVLESPSGSPAGGTVGSDAGVVGLRSDAAVSVGAGIVATASPGVGVCPPQASSAARIVRTVHRGKFSIRETIPIAISEFRVPYG